MSNKKIINAAINDGRKAIIKHLGKNCTRDDFSSVLEVLAHQLVTDCGSLPVGASLHNVEEFTTRLKILIEHSQKDIKNTDCKSFM